MRWIIETFFEILGFGIIIVVVWIIISNGGISNTFDTIRENGLKTVAEDIWYGENNKIENDSLD